MHHGAQRSTVHSSHCASVLNTSKFPFSINIPYERRLDERLTHNSYNSMDHTRWSGRSCVSCLAAFALLLVLVRRNITNQGGNSLNWWPASPVLAHTAYLRLRCSSVYLETTPGDCAAVPGNATRESHEKPYCYPALRCSLALALDSTQKGIPMSRVSILSWCMHPSYISKALVGIQQQLWRCAEMNENDWQYLACSCIAYNHHMMSWVCASQLCAAAGTAHEPP